MQVQVKVNQAEAFRRGINAPHSTAKLEVDPAKLPDDVREIIATHLASVNAEGYRLDVGPRAFPAVISPDVEGLIAAAREQIENNRKEQEDESRRKEDRRKDTLAVIAAGPKEIRYNAMFRNGAIEWGNYQTSEAAKDPWVGADRVVAVLRKWKINWPCYSDESVKDSPEAKAVVEECQRMNKTELARVRPLFEKAQAELDAKIAAEEAEKANKAARRIKQLEDALETHGTNLQKERFKRGKLNLEDEIKPIIVDKAFEPLASLGLSPYQKITADEVREAGGCDEHVDVKFLDSEKVDTITDAEMDMVLQIEKALPNATVKVMMQQGYTADDNADGVVRRRSIDVTLQVGEITCERSFASPSES